MSQLDDLTGAPQYSLDDVVGTPDTKVPVTSLASNKNIAAHAALLSPKPEDTTAIYNQSSAELNLDGQSDLADATVANAKGQSLAGYRGATADLMLNPQASDEWKRSALAQVNDPENGLFSPRAMVATKAASTSVPSETNEAADLRGLFAAGITSVLDYQRTKQQAYNTMQLRQDAQASAGYVGMAEDLVPMVSGYKEARLNNDLFGGDNTFGVKTLWNSVFTGETKQQRADWFNKIPLEDRSRVLGKVMDTVASNGQTILLPESTDNANMRDVQDMVDSGSYGATERTIDNVLGVLDAVGVGSLLRTAGKVVKGAMGAGEAAAGVAKGAEGLSDEARTWQRRFMSSDVQPTTPSQTVKDANPEMARGFHDAMAKDDTDTAANALYGASREDAIAHDIGPQVSAVDGSVQSKVYHPERNSDFAFMPDADVMDFVENSGGHYFSQTEKARLRAQVTNDFTNATGFVQRKEMSTVEDLPDGVSFKSVIGPSDSGWNDIKDAINQASFAYKNYGITPDNISILHRVGDDYKVLDKGVQNTLMSGNNPQIKGDFLLQINHEHKFSAGDMLDEGWEPFNVKYNLMDSWFKNSGRRGQGSVASNLLDPQSMLSFDTTKGATISGARGAQLDAKLGEITKSYINNVKGLSHNEQQQLFSVIRESNAKSISYNYTDMMAQGFSNKAINALEDWKRAQDTNWLISNRDQVRSLQSRGFGLMNHEGSGTRLVVKELPRSAVPHDINVLDPVSGDVRKMSKEEISAHYDNNGNIAKTANPMEIAGQHVEHVLNQNAANGTYVRKLNDHDTVLNYRKGYYAVKYKEPHFIEKKLVDENGKPILDAGGRERWKAVATADTVPNAMRGIERLKSTAGGEYRFRKNLKGEDFDAATSQSLQAGGMSSQRVRGQRLEEGLGSNNIDSDLHMEAPLNSLISASSSIAHRVSHRDWTETMKARFLANYEDILPKKAGRTQWPSDRKEIGIPGIENKMTRDARTVYEYIRQVENGFINGIDEGYKGAFNALADAFGHRGMGSVEKGIRAIAQSGGPAAKIKGLAFNLLLALNPMRQFLVQSHQALMLAASFPTYTVSRLIPDMTLMLTMHLAEGTGVKIPLSYFKSWGRTEKEANDMFKALKESGIAASIKQHDLVREGLNSIADSSAASRFRFGATPLRAAAGVAKTAMAIPRKIGFDFGEYISSSASFLAHYNDALSKGVKMDKAGVEEAFAKSRNYVYNMDRAGAMPYNHNSVSLFTQFLQVPHKAFTQLFFNQGINKVQKAKMVAFMTAMYGPTAVVGIIPGAGDAIENFFGQLFPDDPVVREALRTGLETHFVNKILTDYYQQDVKLDLGSLAPLDAYGITQFIQTALDQGLTKLITNSPGGSLLFGTNPKVAQVLQTFGTLVGMGPLKEQDPTRWSNMFMDIANLSSGYSNAYKASMMLTYQKKYGNLGGTTDSNVHTPEAIAQAFGIPTMDSENSRKIADTVFKTQTDFDNSVKSTFSKYAKVLVQDGITADQWEYTIRMSQIEMQAYGNNDRAAQIWNQEMTKQMEGGDYRLMDKLLKFSGFAKDADTMRMLDMAPGMTEDQKNSYREVMKYNLSQRTDGEK